MLASERDNRVTGDLGETAARGQTQTMHESSQSGIKCGTKI